MPQEYQHNMPNPGQFSFRGLLLYILPAPLVLKLLISILALNPLKIALTGGALFFFYSAAHLTRTTLVRLAESRQRPSPNKVADYRGLSMLFVGVGMILLMLLIRRPIFASLIMTACSVVGYYLVYGLREAEPVNPVDFSAMPKATREAIQGAYKDLAQLENLAKNLTDSEDRAIADHLDKVVAQSYTILELLSRSPNDAGRARRFLNVYIHRIKEILEQYIGLAKYDKADAYRQRLADVLAETSKAFSEQESKLLDDDEFKLDVQLEVLDEQIKNEHKS